MYGHKTVSDDLVALLDYLQIPKVTVLAHDWYVVWRLKKKKTPPSNVSINVGYHWDEKKGAALLHGGLHNFTLNVFWRLLSSVHPMQLLTRHIFHLKRSLNACRTSDTNFDSVNWTAIRNWMLIPKRSSHAFSDVLMKAPVPYMMLRRILLFVIAHLLEEVRL